MVEAARVLSGHDFRSTIQYICFSGEEQGLVGSHHYVDDVVVPMGLDVEGVINLDMIAFVHPDYPDWDANVYADQQLSLWLGQHLARCINDYSVAMDVLVETDGPIWGSDHFWFANTGYPAVFGIDAQLWGAPDWDPYYHTTQDRIETLDLAYHTEFVRGAAAAVAELAELAELVPQIGIADAGPAAPAVPLVRIAPNPFAAQVLFDAGRSGGPLSIAISDASGRVVARLAGGERLRWDGRDAGGRRLAAGIYFYRVIEPAGARGGRVVLLR